MVPLLQREPAAPGFGLQTPAAWAAEMSPVDCRCAWTTLAGRPQLHKANNNKTRYTSDLEEERPSLHEPTPVVLSLGSTTDRAAIERRHHRAAFDSANSNNAALPSVASGNSFASP